MQRRDVLKAGLGLPLLPLADALAAPAGLPERWVGPGTPGWPDAAAWDVLSRQVEGRLSVPVSPFLGTAEQRADALAQLDNPFFIGDQPALTQTSGYHNAWQSQPSARMLAARTPADVAAAVNFARQHRVRLVVKGGGHSYHGTSCAPDSLLVWTRAMNQTALHDTFVPAGAPADTAGQPAVSLGAGAMWIDAYDAVTTRGGRYVQGGGCTTVGVTGLVTGGGFGSFSKAHGTAAASLLEAEVVTADGRIRIVNAYQDPELFWALKGGCGGSFGVVTRLTLRTHSLPEFFGGVSLKVQAADAARWPALVADTLRFYRDALCNPYWGEQLRFNDDRCLQVSMVFRDLTEVQAREVWTPFVDGLKQQGHAVLEPLQVSALPARHMWDAAFFRRYAPQFIAEDTRPGAPPTHMLWKGDQGQVGWYLHGYASAWMPAVLLDEDQRTKAAAAICAAAVHMPVELHCNKGLFGAPANALAATRETATHPAVLEAFALALIGNAGRPVFAGSGGSVDSTQAEHGARRVQDAYTALRAVLPVTAPTYVSECDYFQRDWQQAFWGPHYPRLLAAKRRYDPDGLFVIHHGVGTIA
jgi:FAD/FMN-containing dehydrogenase